jgi:3',5'-cyclic AMP phosphodiesterase CpdA
VSYRLVQLSDPHLSARRGYGVANFDALTAALAASPPDLVVASGDLVLDDPDDGEDRTFARSRFDRLPARWRAVPGNHDIGDDLPDPLADEPVTAARRQAWVDTWGPDWWVEEAGEWVVVGLDSLLFASGLEAEGEQWSFLAEVTASAGARPVMVVVHKPLFLRDPAETDLGSKTIPAEGRRRLAEALGDVRVRLVVSGHLHQFRAWAGEGPTLVWAPSTGFVSHLERPSKYGGTKTVGAVEYRFDGGGVTWRLVRPPGMVDLDVHQLVGEGETLRAAPPMSAA